MSKRYMDFVPARSVDKRTAVVSGAPRRTNVSSTTRVTATRTVTAAKPSVVMPESTATPRARMVRRDTSRRVATQKTVTSQRTVVSNGGAGTRMATVSRKTVTRATVPRSATSSRMVTSDTKNEFAISDKEMKLGEIEDLNPKFVNNDVPKRPLGDGKEYKTNLDMAKADVKEVKSKRLIGRFRGKNMAKTEAKSTVKSDKKEIAKKETFVAPRPMFINQDKVTKRPLSKNVYNDKVVATNERDHKGPVAIIAKPEKESRVGLVVAIILTIILGAVAGTVAFLLLPK